MTETASRAAPSFVKEQRTDADRLGGLSAKVAELRDLDMKVAELEERLRECKERRRELTEETLPKMMSLAGVTSVTVPPEGNMLGYIADLKPYYKAAIAASWPDAKKIEAYQYLEKEGYGDIIKHKFTIDLGRDSEDESAALRETLQRLGYSWVEDTTVNWQTLTALVKEQAQRGVVLDLEKIGATIGEVVKITPIKEK